MRIGALLAATGLLGMVLASAAVVPASPSPTLQQAKDLVEWGRLKQARDLLATALAQPGQSNDAPLVAYDSHVQSLFGDNAAALELAKKSVALDPNCATCHLFLFEAMAKHAKTVSQVHGLLLLPKLKKELEKATALDSSLADVQWGWIDLDLGLPASVGGSVADARTHADTLRQIDPVDGWLAEASVDRASGNPAQEMNDYRQAALADAKDPRGTFDLGKALYLQGHYQEAEPYLARALELNPQSALYNGYEAAELVRLGKLAAARAVLDAGQRLFPDSRLGDFLVAQALKDTRQDFNWARQLLTAYQQVSAEPDQPTNTEAQSLLASLGAN